MCKCKLYLPICTGVRGANLEIKINLDFHQSDNEKQQQQQHFNCTCTAVAVYCFVNANVRQKDTQIFFSKHKKNTLTIYLCTELKSNQK